jgi:hypothetical protein
MPFKTIISGTPPLASDADQYRLGLTGQADVGAISLCPAQGTPAAATYAAGAAGVLTGRYCYREVLITGFNQSDGSHVVNGFVPTPSIASLNLYPEIWSNSDIGNTSGIAVDASGNVYVSYLMGSGKNVRKFNSAGVEQWSLTDVGRANAIAVDASGNVYVAYDNTSGITVRKLNSSGVEQWSNSDVAHAYSIAVDGSGNVYAAYMVAGGTKSVRKFNSAGVEQWNKIDTGYATGIAVDASENLGTSVTDKTVKKLSSAGVEQWSNSDVTCGFKIAVDASGYVYVAYDNTTGITVRKFNNSGVEQWNNSDIAYADGIAVDASGNVYVTYYNSSGKTIRKLNSAGVEQWSDSTKAFAERIAVDSGGNIYVTYASGKDVRALINFDISLTSQQTSLTNIALGSVGCIGRAIYRTASGGAAGTEQFCGIIWDNTTTTYTDNLADVSLGTGMPAVSGMAIPKSVPTGNSTGTPIYLPNGSTAQTPASGDNSKNIATSEFVHATLLSALKSASGWLKDPTTGIYLQWGNVYLTTSSTQFNYPIGFPNVCFQIIGSNGSAFLDFYLTNFTKNAFQGIANGTGGINYFAVGC